MKKEVMLSLENKRVALLVLPFLIFSYLALSISLAQNNIDAEVRVSPSSIIECEPDVLTVGSNVTWINCFITFENADLNEIDLSTVKLTITGCAQSITADQSFFLIDDFLGNGEDQAMVRFSRALADPNCLTISGTKSLQVSGNLNNGIPFSGPDSIQVEKLTTTVFAAYERNKPPPTPEIVTIKDFDLSSYQPQSIVFNGFFTVKKDSKISGTNAFYTSGNIVSQRTIWFLGFIPYTITEKTPYSIAAAFDKYTDCSAIKETKRLHCEGNGSLMIVNQKTGQYSRKVIPFLRFDVIDGVVLFEGGNVWNDMISVRNIPLNNIRIR